MKLKKRNERGATAILVALLAVSLLIVSAFAVDMGHVYAKRSALQSNVDMAVLAAAAHIDGSDSCTAEAVAAATDYLTKPANAVDGQHTVNLGGTADDGNGYLRCIGWRVELTAPVADAPFGFGRLAGVDGVEVPAFAAAEIKAAAAGFTLPMYAVDGCDYGPQTIRDDSGLPPAQVIPPLTPTSETTNDAVLTSVSPSQVPAATTSANVVVTGTNLADVTALTFTGAGGPPDHHEVLAANFISQSATQIEVQVPAAVLAVEDVWFIRVLKGADYSPEQQAQIFTVGESRLFCAGSVDGNFGTLDIPRDGTPFDLEWNIIEGIQPSLAIHPSPAGECGGDPLPTIESKTGPVNGTNCLATETGLKVAQTNAGLITGKGGKDGRLDKDSTANCSRSGDSSRTPTAINGVHINDDLFSCFIINGARIQDLVNGNTVAEQALSADIFSSPRFFYIPVVQLEPFTGKKSWPIVDFRPGFITDQAVSATNASPGSISAHNGIVAEPSGVRELHVILFNEISLPEFAPAQGGEGEYTGTGPKVIVLVD